MSASVRRAAVLLAALIWPVCLLADPQQDLLRMDQECAVLGKAGKYAEAEHLARRMVALAERSFPNNAGLQAVCLDRLGSACLSLHKLDEAEKTFQRTLALFEKASGRDSTDVATSLNNLANVYVTQGRYPDAEKCHLRALPILEKARGADHPEVATSLNNLGNVYKDMARFTDAEKCHLRALAIREKAFGAEHRDVADSLNNLGTLYGLQARLDDEEKSHRRALAIREKALGPNHPDLATSLTNMALVLSEKAQFAESEQMHRRALAIKEKVFGADSPDAALSLYNLAQLSVRQGQYADAEPLHRQALAIRERRLGREHPETGASLNALANLYKHEGRYAEAEVLYKRALAIATKAHGREHPETADTLNNLAIIYAEQARYAEAEKLFQEALAIRRKILGPDHPVVASCLESLAHVAGHLGRPKEAERLYQDALAVREKRDPEATVPTLEGLAQVAFRQDRYADAEQYDKRALTIREKRLGPNHPDVALSLRNLAVTYRALNRLPDAESLLDRAITILDRTGASPGERAECYDLRARTRWQANHRSAALADLRAALDLATQQRGRTSGAERETSQAFGQHLRFFERMVSWQAELGDVAEAFAAAERARARSLLDQLELRGADLLARIPDSDSEPLRRRLRDAQIRTAALERELRLVEQDKGRSADQRRNTTDKLGAELAEARQTVLDIYGDIRNVSPIYRLTVGKDRLPASLSAVHAWATQSKYLVLEYVLGSEASFLVVIPPSDEKPRVGKLLINDDQAKVLGVSAGALTADRARAALINDENTGILQLLSDANRTAQAVARLHALTEVLLPPAELEQLAGGKVKQLVILPDGALALLPFEALVVATDGQPRYLLDAGVPIAYGPSATVLLNLAERPAAPIPAGRAPVLAVGNPAYSDRQSGSDETLQQLAAGSRYRSAGGRFTPLPYSETEVRWLTDNCRAAGMEVRQLLGREAREAHVRAEIAGRLWVHLACHGFADQTYGNFFGALALTPGPQDKPDPADDGFLTLGEIYELDLQCCELAILSACETNFGPQQRGEGVWALSRGFLVAGARRVVASNWLVDDEAAASLVSVFIDGLAKAEKKGNGVNYAQELHEAKQWVRQQAKWQSPYYWASFLLVGPGR
jgi:CHAT domain-containing protein/tetratricopeptide (TPR) repeat protein